MEVALSLFQIWMPSTQGVPIDCPRHRFAESKGPDAGVETCGMSECNGWPFLLDQGEMQLDISIIASDRGVRTCLRHRVRVQPVNLKPYRQFLYSKTLAPNLECFLISFLSTAPLPVPHPNAFGPPKASLA